MFTGGTILVLTHGHMGLLFGGPPKWMGVLLVPFENHQTRESHTIGFEPWPGEEAGAGIILVRFLQLAAGGILFGAVCGLIGARAAAVGIDGGPFFQDVCFPFFKDFFVPFWNNNNKDSFRFSGWVLFFSTFWLWLSGLMDIEGLQLFGHGERCAPNRSSPLFFFFFFSFFFFLGFFFFFFFFSG